jgi:phosphonate transport system permease protein
VSVGIVDLPDKEKQGTDEAPVKQEGNARQLAADETAPSPDRTKTVLTAPVFPPKPKRDPVLIGIWSAAGLFFVCCLYVLHFPYERLGMGTLKLFTYFGMMFPPNAADWRFVLSAALQSLEIAIVGTAGAVIVAFFLSFAAAANLSPRTAMWVKGFAGFLRGVPTLVWALVFIVAIGMGPVPGIMAIGTHALGYCIKMFAQSIEEMDKDVLEALRASGATWTQIVFQGVVPSVTTALISWSVFRLEIDIGESTILGVVGAGGIGFELSDAMRSFEFQKVLFIAIVVFAMVFSVEMLSNRLKIWLK